MHRDFSSTTTFTTIMMPGNNAPPSGRRILYWFRTDLRLMDSPALRASLGMTIDADKVKIGVDGMERDKWDVDGIDCFYPVWCFDPQYVWKHKVGLNRWQFLLQSMNDLSSGLTRLNPEQKLLVLRGSPEEVLPIVWKEWGITDMYFEKDTAAYARRRDTKILELAKISAPQLKVHFVVGHNLLDPEEVVTRGNNGHPITTLQSWKKAAAKVGSIPRSLPAPTSLPPPGKMEIVGLNLGRRNLLHESKRPVEDGIQNATSMDGPFAKLKGENVNHEIMEEKQFNCFDSISGPWGDFSIPTMDQLGLSGATTHILGGETEGRRRLESFLADKRAVATFSKPASSPTALEPSTTLLSPYFKFGCVSVRELYWRAKDISDTFKPMKGDKITKEPENIAGQLEFREMYYCAEFATENYDRIRGNSLSRFMNWSLMNEYDQKGEMIMPRSMGNARDEERLQAWKEGRTGFPWIDAVMRQLKQEGWIHHLARHSVACFLTRGQCYISWERGAEVFDEYLLDWDPASNPGNWMWLSCSAFFSQFFRVYGLVSWPMKTDKKGLFVRKYCPELREMPDKYIYEPSKAPLAIQKAARCVIGQDYPFPMLDERKEKERCLSRLKVAFNLGLRGSDPKVMDGTAKSLLAERFAKMMGRNEYDEDEDGDEILDEKKVVKKRGRGEKVDTGPMDMFVKKQKRSIA